MGPGGSLAVPPVSGSEYGIERGGIEAVWLGVQGGGVHRGELHHWRWAAR